MADQDTVKELDVQLDEEAKKLKLEAIKAEARKSIAQAQQERLAAQLPKSEVTPPEGKVELGEKVGLLAEVVAYSALRDVAAQVAGSVKKHTPDGAFVLIVESRALFATDWPYAVIHDELAGHLTALQAATDALESRAPAAAPPAKEPEEPRVEALGVPLAAVTPGLAVAEGVVGGAAGIAAMFRNDYTISSRETKVGSTPLVAAVASELASATRTVVVDGFELVIGSRVLADFNAARAQRRRLEHAKIEQEQSIAADAANSDALRARVKDAGADYDKALAEAKSGVDLKNLEDNLHALQSRLAELDAALAEPRAVIAVASAAAARFDAFATVVTTLPAGAPYPPLVSAALREQLHAQRDAKVTHVLFVEVDTAGAETVAIRSLFRQRARFVGGLHVSYLLLAVEVNKIVKAGTAAGIRQMNYRLRTGKLEHQGSADLYVPNSPPQ